MNERHWASSVPGPDYKAARGEPTADQVAGGAAGGAADGAADGAAGAAADGAADKAAPTLKDAADKAASEMPGDSIDVAERLRVLEVASWLAHEDVLRRLAVLEDAVDGLLKQVRGPAACMVQDGPARVAGHEGPARVAGHEGPARVASHEVAPATGVSER